MTKGEKDTDLGLVLVTGVGLLFALLALGSGAVWAFNSFGSGGLTIYSAVVSGAPFGFVFWYYLNQFRAR